MTVGAHCGKPQSQNACSPQLEEEEDHGKMYQQLYSVNLSSMQRHGKSFPLIFSLSFFPNSFYIRYVGSLALSYEGAPSPCLMLSPAEDMRGRIEADTSSSTLEEEFPPDLLKRQAGIIKDTKHTFVLMWKMSHQQKKFFKVISPTQYYLAVDNHDI